MTRLALPVALLLLLAFGSASADAAPRLQKVGDFDAPVYVAAAPGDYNRLYVVERAGTVRAIRDG